MQQGIENYQQGQARFDPYAQGGAAGFNALTNALGLGGADAQQSFMDSYMADPSIDLMQQATARRMAASGMTNSGANRLAAARVHQEGYNNHLNRLTGVGQMGQQAAGAQAGLDQGIGDMRFGTGQLKANQATGFGNAMADSRSIGVNNLMGAVGMGLKATGWGGFGVPGK